MNVLHIKVSPDLAGSASRIASARLIESCAAAITICTRRCWIWRNSRCRIWMLSPSGLFYPTGGA